MTEIAESITHVNRANFVLFLLIAWQAILACAVALVLWDVAVLTYVAPLTVWIIVTVITSVIVLTPKNKLFMKLESFGLNLHSGLAISHVTTAIASISIICGVVLGILNSRILDLIINYRRDIGKKQLMDKIQSFFSCCGGLNMTDWFFTDWQNTQLEPRKSKSLGESGWDAVPFSCCSWQAQTPCHNQALMTFGLKSLHTTACATALERATIIYLGLLAVLSLFTAILFGQQEGKINFCFGEEPKSPKPKETHEKNSGSGKSQKDDKHSKRHQPLYIYTDGDDLSEVTVSIEASSSQLGKDEQNASLGPLRSLP